MAWFWKLSCRCSNRNNVIYVSSKCGAILNLRKRQYFDYSVAPYLHIWGVVKEEIMCMYVRRRKSKWVSEWVRKCRDKVNYETLNLKGNYIRKKWNVQTYVNKTDTLRTRCKRQEIENYLKPERVNNNGNSSELHKKSNILGEAIIPSGYIGCFKQFWKQFLLKM